MKHVTIAIIRCKDCGKLELSCDNKAKGIGRRLGGHKCSGQWDVVMERELTVDTWRSHSAGSK